MKEFLKDNRGNLSMMRLAQLIITTIATLILLIVCLYMLVNIQSNIDFDSITKLIAVVTALISSVTGFKTLQKKFEK